ncbi:MAG: ABC transporter ATP-binding protein [Thermoplasmata archaeon]
MPNPDDFLVVEGLCASLGRSEVLHNIGFGLGRAELLALMGPNGSGKTTLLRVIAGLERPTSGRVVLDGVDVTGWPAHRRRIALLAQDPALLPGRSVLENAAYGPLVQGRPPGEARSLGIEALRNVRLEELAGRPASALSGGERQRVALARVIAARPRVVLLDEPFASIDPEVRGELRGEFRRILSDLGIPSIHVTHDREEGLFLGDRVAILLDGRLEPPGTPSEVLDHPASARVARFLGYSVLATKDGTVALDAAEIRIVPVEEGLVRAELLASGRTGREEVAILRTDAGDRVEVRVPLRTIWPRPGTVVGLRWEHARALPEETP